MRTAHFRSRHRKLVVCPANGYFWMYRGRREDDERVSCPDCKGSFILAEISLKKRKPVV